MQLSQLSNGFVMVTACQLAACSGIDERQAMNQTHYVTGYV